MSEASKTQTIRQQNDRFRADSSPLRILNAAVPGRYVMTQGISQLSHDDQLAVWRKVRTFSDFNDDNDPHGEHDFGAFDHAGQKMFWKIDYYDRAFEFGSEDPADLEQTRRVLTVMLADEY